MGWCGRTFGRTLAAGAVGVLSASLLSTAVAQNTPPVTQPTSPSNAPASTPASASAAAVPPSLKPQKATVPCRLRGVSHDAQCGVVQRPLDPSQPNGVQIDVHYAVLPALARNKEPDPVFLFAGGPGQSAIELSAVAFGALQRFTNRRDIVLVDQRGTGRSAPLMCEPSDPWQPLARQADLAQNIRDVERCREALQQQPHGDLRQYTTTIAMADVDAVREALGAAQINAVGGSYGTRAVLEYMRLYPKRVRSAVIDGVAPADMVLPVSGLGDSQAALDASFLACATDPRCEAQFPNLQRRWRAWMATLPQRVTVTHPMRGEAETFMLTRDAVLNALRTPLYAPSSAAAVPMVAHAAVQGRLEPLMAMAGGGSARRAGAIALGMHFSVVCAEDVPRMAQSTDAPGQDFDVSYLRMHEAVCAGWPRGVVPADFYNVPPSQVPTLVLSGGLDPVTPPRHGARISQRLGPAAVHVVVPNAGHGLMGLACLRDQLYRFVDEADKPSRSTTKSGAADIDLGCATAIPRPPSFLPPSPPLPPSVGASSPRSSGLGAPR
jgi:pimeloyl-ACP methyl ester carboxylesterase